ncbi:MAG: NTPase [Candidatus Hadarchaeota archaeon]
MTGSPGSGKTSVVNLVVKNLSSRGFRAGGVYCPEIREGGVRVGFKMVDLMTGEEQLLAHIKLRAGPQVGKYRVNVAGIDKFSEAAIGRALREADFAVIDEIAPMEIHSEGFKRAVLSALDSNKPLLAVIHQYTVSGFIGAVKARHDVKIFELKNETRPELPDKLVQAIGAALDFSLNPKRPEITH